MEDLLACVERAGGGLAAVRMDCSFDKLESSAMNARTVFSVEVFGLSLSFGAVDGFLDVTTAANAF